MNFVEILSFAVEFHTCVDRQTDTLQFRMRDTAILMELVMCKCFNTLRTGLLNCLNARSRGLTFRHRASSM